jgi:hypothetical protein
MPADPVIDYTQLFTRLPHIYPILPGAALGSTVRLCPARLNLLLSCTCIPCLTPYTYEGLHGGGVVLKIMSSPLVLGHRPRTASPRP